MSPDVILRRRGDLPVSPWRNGGGRTREVLVLPQEDGSPLARVSMAEVAQDGPFSAYPGVARVLTVISGDPLALTIDGEEALLGVGEVLAFPGDADTRCRLTGSAVEDLGVMTWPCGGAPAQAARLELLAGDEAEVSTGHLVAVVVSEPVSLDGTELGRGDSVQVRAGTARLAGRGTVALVSL